MRYRASEGLKAGSSRGFARFLRGRRTRGASYSQPSLGLSQSRNSVVEPSSTSTMFSRALLSGEDERRRGHTVFI